MTDIACVGRAELELDDIHSTDPAIVDNMDNFLSRLGDALKQDTVKCTCKSSRSYDTTSDSTSHGETMIERDKENLSVQSGVKRDGCARIS